MHFRRRLPGGHQAVHTFVLPLLLCCVIAEDTPTLVNLDFSAGTTAAWEGDGFAVEITSGTDAAQACSITSKDTGARGHKATLHRAFVVPMDAGYIRFKAY